MAAHEDTHDSLHTLKDNKKKKNNVAQVLEKHQAFENKLLCQKFPSSSTQITIIEQHPQETESGNNSTSVQKNYKTRIERKLTFSLDSFIKKPNKVIKQKKAVKEIYKGNILDSDNPVRSCGKHSETPKKKIHSKLKEDILKHEMQGFLSDSKVIYVDNLITDELNQATSGFLKKIVTFQENAFIKDQEKAKVKRRYVLGLHETKKYFLSKKICFLIIADDMRIHSDDEVLYKDIFNLKQLAKDNGIPYVFALKRSKIGNLTKTYRPISCVGILNYQSAEDSICTGTTFPFPKYLGERGSLAHHYRHPYYPNKNLSEIVECAL